MCSVAVARVFLVLVAASCGPKAADSTTVSLRRAAAAPPPADAGRPSSSEGQSLDDIRKGVAEEWDSMDEFLEIMFSLACKWKNGKDVHGAAAEKLKEGSLDAGKDFDNFMKKSQADNVQMLTRACGTIVAKQKGACRESCATRWNKMMEKRDTCDEQCVTAYTKFEASCKSKASNLETVYKMKLQQASAKKQCFEGHCPSYPTVWMMEDVAKMNAEVDARCKGSCTEASVKTHCTQKWQLEIDFAKAATGSQCAEDSASLDCFDGKAGAINAAQTTCASDGKKTCDTQYTECKAKGNTDANFKEAGEFCDSRKKMCETQVTARCLNEHEKAMEAAKKECETDDSKAFETCKDEELDKKMSDFVDKCAASRMPKCDEECHQNCAVDKMNTCLDNMKSEDNPNADFCSDFWDLLHDSSQIDPSTGAPIVLLASK